MAISGKVAGSVGGVGIAGAATTLLIWAAKLKWNIDIPEPVGDALTTLIAAFGALLGGYIIPHTEVPPHA